jgi:hypothetical protein
MCLITVVGLHQCYYLLTRTDILGFGKVRESLQTRHQASRLCHPPFASLVTVWQDAGCSLEEYRFPDVLCSASVTSALLAVGNESTGVT